MLAAAAPGQLPKFTVEECYARGRLEESQIIPQEPAEPEAHDASAMADAGSSPPDSGIRCDQHNRPAIQFCFCEGALKTYLCEACLSSHIAIVGQHDLLPASADVISPDQIRAYRHKTRLLAKTKEMRRKLINQKEEFDVCLQQTLENMKSMLDLVFTEITSAALCEFESFQAALEQIQVDLESWQLSNQSFAKDTKLFVHYFEVSTDEFNFFDLASDISSRVSMSFKEGPNLRSLESLITAKGSMCICASCEDMRTALDLPSALPWTCLQCHTLRTLEKSCGECGCGPSILDLLMYREVEISENRDMWKCQSCGEVNPINTKDCLKCKQEAGKKKRTFRSFIPFSS
jgi:hypothetical protein